MPEKIVSIDWCDDTLKRELPWDSEQYVEVKRLNNRDRGRRNSLGGSFKMGADGSTENMEISVAIAEIKEFEWEKCIVDFRFVDGKGKVFTFGKRDVNKKLLSFAGKELSDFIDTLIAEINKEDDASRTVKEVEDVEENLKGS